MDTKSTTTSIIKEGLLLFLLAGINFTHIMDFVIMAPLNPFLKEALTMNTSQFGMLVASYTLSAGLAGLVAFFFIDRYDRRSAMLFLYTGFVIGNILCAVADTYFFLLSARIIAGAFGGVINALILSVIGDVIPFERRGKAMGIVMSAFSAASVLGIPTGIMLAGYYNYHAPFILLSGLSTLMLLALFFLFPSIRLHLGGGGVGRKEVLKSFIADNNVRWALLFVILLTLAGFTVVPFISDYMVFNLGLPKDKLSNIYFIGGLATVVSGPIVGILSDKFGKKRVFIIGAILSIFPVTYATMLPMMPLWALLIFTAIYFVLFGARFVPAMTLVTATVDGRRRGSFMSINSSVQQMASALSAVISGAIISNAADGSLQNFWIVGILAACATILCLIVVRKIKEVS